MGMFLHRPIRTSLCAICRRWFIRPCTRRAASGCRPTLLQGHLLERMHGALAGADDAAEKLDIFTSSSGSAAHGTGIWTLPSLENE
eukprot:2779721-Pyramimonas_sp.AAC.1